MIEQGPKNPKEAYANWKAPEGEKKGRSDVGILLSVEEIPFEEKKKVEKKGISDVGILESVEDISMEEADRLVKASKEKK